MIDLTFISADWSKDARKRSVHVADTGQRRIWREESARWDLRKLLELARGLEDRGPVLVGLDLALGVPAGYWSQVIEQPRWRDVGSFLDWLPTLDPSSDFFETTPTAAAWRVDRPFFHIPKGKGSLTAYKDRIRGGLLRRIDGKVGAKPIFAVSGIPGTVGSGTRDLWMELIPLLTEDRDFAVWPFEGDLEDLLAAHPITLAETYPGLAYAAALSATLPTHRLAISKTKREAREVACDLLEAAAWVREAGVDLGDLSPARADEDAFDSHLTAAALLRCVIEGMPLCDPGLHRPDCRSGDPAGGARRPVDAALGGSRLGGKPCRRNRSLRLGSTSADHRGTRLRVVRRVPKRSHKAVSTTARYKGARRSSRVAGVGGTDTLDRFGCTRSGTPLSVIPKSASDCLGSNSAVGSELNWKRPSLFCTGATASARKRLSYSANSSAQKRRTTGPGSAA